MDRNGILRRVVKSYYVALRKESVDRNPRNVFNAVAVPMSLSARRAWIEISVYNS